jgi:hypothetical protein
MSRFSIFKEFWAFVRERKRYWLVPVIVILVLMGVLLVVAEHSAIAPFIYSLF